MGSFDPMGVLGGARTSPHAPVHRLDEPTGLSLGMVASPQCRFRFARRDHCNSATTCRFSTSVWPVISPEPRPARPESRSLPYCKNTAAP
jgi:hypothetical protein